MNVGNIYCTSCVTLFDIYIILCVSFRQDFHQLIVVLLSSMKKKPALDQSASQTHQTITRQPTSV